MAPFWVLDLPEVMKPKVTEDVPKLQLLSHLPGPPTRPATGLVGRDEVLAAIPDKIALARSWGLRIAYSRPNVKGWFSCHAIDREDATPSAAISADSGVYSEMRDGTKLSFFDLAVELGQYADWQAPKSDLAAWFGVASSCVYAGTR